MICGLGQRQGETEEEMVARVTAALAAGRVGAVRWDGDGSMGWKAQLHAGPGQTVRGLVRWQGERYRLYLEGARVKGAPTWAQEDVGQAKLFLVARMREKAGLA